MTTPASYPTGANQAFNSGVAHPINSGRQNVGSITLNDTTSADQGLDQTSAGWSATTPHGVLRTALSSGSPADTDAGIEFGQQALGPGMNTGDQEQAGQSWDRALMQRAAGIGSDDNTA